VPLCKAKSQAAVAHRIRTEITFGLEGGYDFGGLSMGSALPMKKSIAWRTLPDTAGPAGGLGRPAGLNLR